jgi:hypothetical protein
MTKKYVLAGAIVAFLAAANVAYAPIENRGLSKFQKPSLETITANVLGEKYAKEQEEFEKTLEEIREENRDALLSSIDKIYGFICNAYKNQEVQIPDYITKRFIRNIIRMESTDYSRAIGKAGERGYMQLMEDTWYEVEKEDFKKNAFIPEKNIEAGVKYMVQKIDTFCRKNHPNWENLSDWEKIKLIAASYNGGKNKLRKMNWDINKMKKGTRDYIVKLDKLYNNPKIVQ